MAKVKYLTLEEYSDKSGESMAAIMALAGKDKQRRNPAPFKNHYVVINTKQKYFLIHPDQIGAFE